MKKGILIASAVLILVGILIIGTTFFFSGGFKIPEQVKYNQKFFSSDEKITSIDIDVINADVEIITGEEELDIEYYESEYLICTVKISDGRLTIEQKDTRKWYQYFLFDFSGSKPMTIRLPESEFESVKTETINGEIDAGEIKTVSAEFETTNGSIELENIVSEKDIRTTGVNGSIEIKSVTAKELFADTVSGSISLNNAEIAGEISFETVNGRTDIESTVCRTLNASAANGQINISAAAEEINASIVNGEIKLKLPEDESKYRISASTISGNCNVKDTDSGEYRINASSVNGAINISFNEK